MLSNLYHLVNSKGYWLSKSPDLGLSCQNVCLAGVLCGKRINDNQISLTILLKWSAEIHWLAAEKQKFCFLEIVIVILTFFYHKTFYTSAEGMNVFVTYLFVRWGLLMYYRQGMFLFLQSRKVRSMLPPVENALSVQDASYLLSLTSYFHAVCM